VSRPFEENRELAAGAIDDMYLQLSRMARTYNNYIDHGAVNAAAQLHEEMEDLGRDILAEEEIYRMAFY